MRTDVKERPILFSAPMVRAILGGRKTVTRRIVKGGKAFNEWDATPNDAYDVVFGDQGCASFLVAGDHGYTDPVDCPYGAPGDRLFVKETWRAALDLDKYSPTQIGEKSINAGYSKPWAPLKYEADDVEVNRGSLRDFGDAWGKTRYSIHMPRWASRITLEVTGVRVERLHAITEEDANAEGVEPYVYGHGTLGHGELQADPGFRTPAMYRAGFEQVWREINGEESWDANPWVWVLSFQRCP